MNETLRALREQNNYSQAAVASYLNISRQMYIKYENGDSVPPVKIVVDLCNFYRVPYDVILEDKLNNNQKEKQKAGIYDIPDEPVLELHDSGSTFGPVKNSPSYYLKTILEMLPKLVYKERLKVLEEVSKLVYESTKDEIKTKKQNTIMDEITKLNNKYHPKSNGTKYSRDELYERK